MPSQSGFLLKSFCCLIPQSALQNDKVSPVHNCTVTEAQDIQNPNLFLNVASREPALPQAVNLIVWTRIRHNGNEPNSSTSLSTIIGLWAIQKWAGHRFCMCAHLVGGNNCIRSFPNAWHKSPGKGCVAPMRWLVTQLFYSGWMELKGESGPTIGPAECGGSSSTLHS